ncbi:IS66 family transposase [Thermotalea metallivorans]
MSKIVKKSRLGQATNYSLSNCELLRNVLKDGRCELINNSSENSSRIL